MESFAGTIPRRKFVSFTEYISSKFAFAFSVKWSIFCHVAFYHSNILEVQFSFLSDFVFLNVIHF